MSSIADQMIGFSWEKRPLKRPRLGPPDCYPQDPRQREDELTAHNVKQGFSHFPQISDESGTSKNCNISAAKLGTFINGTLSRKAELNALPDSGKRRLQVNTKDHFWPVVPRNKTAVEAWMKDLAGGKPLSSLGKRVPIFNKREEIFLTLAEHSVPMVRATWFLKMTATYNSAISEAKTKKRQMPDPSQEWTISMLKCLRDILVRLSDWYNGGNGTSTAAIPTTNGPNTPNPTYSSTGGQLSQSGTVNSGASTPPSTVLIPEDGNLSLRQWMYCTDLAKHLYEEGLLDRFEWLQWIIDSCEKTKSLEDGGWKALDPLLLAFIPDFAQSELLARRLAHLASSRLSLLFSEFELPSTAVIIPSVQPPSALLEHLHCPTHRTTVLTLVSALQVITLECPTALVYNSISNGGPPPPIDFSTRVSVPPGSPLDLIPIPPSALPMPPRANNHIVRNQLRMAEDEIRQRSRAVEAKWSCEEWQQSSAGTTLHRVLEALDALDRHCFDKVEQGNNFDYLYSKIFSSPPNKENPAEADASIVLLLCQWAVGPQRTGEHRAISVAKLLEMRQNDVMSPPDTENQSGLFPENNTPIKNESMSGDDVTMNGNGSDGNGEVNENSQNGISNDDDSNEPFNGLPIYHNLLFKFLDTDAPILVDDSSIANRIAFASLVHLFAALIRQEIFSHDAYLCTLVARGDLASVGSQGSNGPNSTQPQIQAQTPGPNSHPGPTTPVSVSSVTPGATPHHDLNEDRGPLFAPLPRMDIPRQSDYDDKNIDDDLVFLVQGITNTQQEQQNNMDQVDSPKDESGGTGFQNHSSGTSEKSIGASHLPPAEAAKQSRHRLYVKHFPLPLDESYQHEVNQRHILLYGFGRSRDEARHIVKKVSKELGKLFSKKFSYDISDGSRVKKHSKTEINLETLQGKFSGLPYFDQNSITSLIGQSAVEMVSSFASGRGNYLPTIEHLSYLSELMEIAFNITGLLDLCIQLLRDLPDVEYQLNQRGSGIANSYSSSLLLVLVAILRRYQCSVLIDNEMTQLVREYLVRIMKRYTSSGEGEYIGVIPSVARTADRCALAYLTELHSSCVYFRTKNFGDFLTPAAAKLRSSLCNPVKPSDGSHGWTKNKTFMTQNLDNPRRHVEPMILCQLKESQTLRYAFVVNSILSISNEADFDRLNDLASLCAEMTAAVPSIAAEWLGVLRCLCSPTHHGLTDVLSEVRVKDLSIHPNLATLTALLVARQCFSLQDIVVVAAYALLSAWQQGRGPTDGDTEAGARLTVQLLLSLFKTQEPISGALNNGQTPVLKLSCDRRLLSATHNSVTLGPVLAVLKAMLLVADAAGSGERHRVQRNLPGMSQAELSISHILGTSDPSSERSDSIRGEQRTLAAFALSALQQMCSETWVRQRCLQIPEEFCKPDMLLDPMMSQKQAQRLLHLVCYPEHPVPEESLDPRILIPRVMEGLDQWNLREAWLNLTLQSKQLTCQGNNMSEYQNWLDIVARSCLEVFNLDEGQDYNVQSSATPSPAPGKSPRSGGKKQQEKTPPTVPPPKPPTEKGERPKSAAAWLIAPLVQRLSPTIQGRVLKHAGNVLENSLWPRGRGKITTSGSLHSHLPFLALILTCLRGQDEQREGLLTSLHTQFTNLLAFSKEPETEGKAEALRDSLRLRLSLVGGMFDAIQRSANSTTEWAVILTQLVTHGVIDLNINPDVFPTIVDMVTALVHFTQTSETNERIDDSRKQNTNLIKKLKKELMDRNAESVKPLRQLLPIPKVSAEIIVTQPTSFIVDSKGNRVQSFEYVDKKPGLQVWEKQRVSPWELLEGQRNIAPLSWSWFGAVKQERRSLRYEEAHRLLKYHTHCLLKSPDHFYEPVPLPPEEIDSKPEILIKEEILMKPDTPSSDQSPRGGPGGPRSKAPKPPRKKRQTKAQQQQAALAAQQITSPVGPPPIANSGSPFPPGPNMPPGPAGAGPNYQGGPPQWGYNGQQNFYPQQPVTNTRPINQSKQALQTLLRQRHVGPPGPTPNQYQQFPPAGPPGPRHQILRQQLRGQTPAGPMQPTNFQGQPNQIYPPQQQPHGPIQPQQGMGQNYPYNAGQMANPAGGQIGPGVPGPGMNPAGGPPVPMQPGMMPRGPIVQDMGYSMGGPSGPVAPNQRPMGPRGPFPPGQGMAQGGMGYTRPAGPMNQMQGGMQMGGMVMQQGGGMMGGGMVSQSPAIGPGAAMQKGPMVAGAGQQMAGQTMGGQAMPGQAMGGQQMAGQAMGGQPMGGQPMGGQQMGGQPIGQPPMPNQSQRLRHIMMQQQQQQHQNMQMGQRPQMHYNQHQNPNQPGAY